MCLCVPLPCARPGLCMGKAEEEQLTLVPKVPGQGGAWGKSLHLVCGVCLLCSKCCKHTRKSKDAAFRLPSVASNVPESSMV